MARHQTLPPSPAFEEIARGAQFRDLVAIRVTASPAAVFRALHEVALPDMKLAWLLGEIRYLPSRLAGRMRDVNFKRPFFAIVTGGGNLVLLDDRPREVVTGSAAQLHRVNQSARRFDTREAFDAFEDPEHEKLFISIRVTPTGRTGEHWLVLEHATRALSPATERKFARYWRVIKPLGAFASRQLLRAVRRRAQRADAGAAGSRRVWRTVRASRSERMRALPGDNLIGGPVDATNQAVTIHRPPRDVWPWLAQMGAGSRAGWYSYDFLDNGRQPSATWIVPELQQISAGMTFPALPGVTDCFTLLSFEPGRFLVLGWMLNDTLVMTWAFVLEDAAPGSTRLLVRTRAQRGAKFQEMPWWLAIGIAPALHFFMQRKQLLGIARRAESMPPGDVATFDRLPEPRKDAA